MLNTSDKVARSLPQNLLYGSAESHYHLSKGVLKHIKAGFGSV
ncbi:hypothetical protein [Aurantivibrio infirmus]